MEVVHVFLRRPDASRCALHQAGQAPESDYSPVGLSKQECAEGWCLEYEHHLDLRLGFAPQAHKFKQAQKKAAVEYYRTHDRCVSATMRALGYPGRATLTAWVREAFPETSKAVTGSTGRPRYPETLKKAGVVRLHNRQESAQALAEKLGVCRPTLYNWKNQLLGPEAPAIMKRKNNSPPVSERKADQDITWRTKPNRISKQSWHRVIKPVQVFIRSPTVINDGD